MRVVVLSARGVRRGLMAAVMAHAMAPRGVDVVLAARSPGAADPEAVEALRAVGLDAAALVPLPLDAVELAAADAVIVVSGADGPDGALDWRSATGPIVVDRERLRESLAAYFQRLEP